MEENKETKEIAKKDINLTFNSLKELRAFGEEIVKSKLVPATMKSPEDVLVAVLTGKELGMAPMFAINNIHPVQGRATIGVHALSALLLSKGITIEVIYDYQPCVNFVLKDIEKSEQEKKDIWLNSADGKPVIIRQGFYEEVARDFEIKGKNIVNYRTVIKFARMVKQGDGKFKEVIAFGEFSIQEAYTAGIYKAGGSWEKYPKNMTYARALAFGARKIAADIMAGMYETSEYMDFSNIKYDINDEGNITEDVKHEEVK